MCYCATAQNHVLDLKNEKAYLDLGTGSVLKPTESISFFFWAFHTDWQQITNKPTLLGNTQHVGYALSLTLDQVQAWFSVDSVYQTVDFPLALLRSGWHHFGVIFSGQEIQLYIDGALVERKLLPQKATLMQPDSTISLMIGAETRYNRVPHPDLFFDGMMDEIRIYQRGLSEAEARAVYLGDDAKVTSEGLVLHLPFEGDLHDLSSYQHEVMGNNFPEIQEASLPARGLVVYQRWLAHTSGLIALATLLWLVYSFKKQRSFWIIGFWLAQTFIFLYFDSSSVLWQLGFGISQDIRLDYFLDFLMLGSLLVFVKTLFACFHKYLATWIWLSIGVSLISIGILPIQMKSWIIVLGGLSSAGAIAWIATLHKQQPLLWMPVLGLFFAMCLLVLELLNILDFSPFAAINNPLSFALFAVGLYPIIRNEKMAMVFETQEEVNISEALQLSPKEEEVCRLLIAGRTNIEIAEMLGVSVNTVKTYNKRIFAKAGVNSRRELLSVVKN